CTESAVHLRSRTSPRPSTWADQGPSPGLMIGGRVVSEPVQPVNNPAATITVPIARRPFRKFIIDVPQRRKVSLQGAKRADRSRGHQPFDLCLLNLNHPHIYSSRAFIKSTKPALVTASERSIAAAQPGAVGRTAYFTHATSGKPPSKSRT